MSYPKNKQKKTFVGLSDNLYSTGNKSPMYEFEKKASSFKFKCSITGRKYKFSEYLKWWQSSEIQAYVKQGYELWIQTKTQEPYKPPHFGDNIEQILTFRMKAPYTRKPGMGTFKRVADSIPAMPVQEFAPENAKPVTMEDYKNLDNQREPGDDTDEELDDTIPF